MSRRLHLVTSNNSSIMTSQHIEAPIVHSGDQFQDIDSELITSAIVIEASGDQFCHIDSELITTPIAIEVFGDQFYHMHIKLGNVSTRIDWLRQPSKKQGFRNNVKCKNHKKQGFRIDFDWAFVSFLTGLSYHVLYSFTIKFTRHS